MLCKQQSNDDKRYRGLPSPDKLKSLQINDRSGRDKLLNSAFELFREAKYKTNSFLKGISINKEAVSTKRFYSWACTLPFNRPKPCVSVTPENRTGDTRVRFLQLPVRHSIRKTFSVIHKNIYTTSWAQNTPFPRNFHKEIIGPFQ